MSQVDLPEEILNKMTCLTCKHLLSVYPVYVKKDGSGAICGRCQPNDKAENQYLRDESFEALAQFLLFPCIYKENGCPKKLLPSVLEEHETYCEFKKFDCPSSFYTNCDWKGSKSQVYQHFKEKHPKLIMENQTFEFDFLNSVEEKLVTKFEEEIFIVKKEVDVRKEMFLCTVEHLKSKEINNVYTYFLRLEGSDRNYFHKCPEKAADGEEAIKLFGKVLREKLHDPSSIIVKVVIRHVPEQTDIPAKEETSEEDRPNVEWEFLSELECPVCYEYMVPPIYQCTTGHSICKRCKKMVNNVCPICKDSISAKQNFALEKLTQHIIYPCKFYRKGCKFTCKSVKIEDHETCCDFGNFDCPFKIEKDCPWHDQVSEVVAHVENNHNDSILKNNRIEIPFNFDEPKSKVFLIIYNKKVFKFSFNFSDHFCEWSMKLMGTLKESNEYKFQIDILDTTGNKKHIFISGSVIPYTAQVDAKNSIKLSEETLRAMIEDELIFVVKLMKN